MSQHARAKIARTSGALAIAALVLFGLVMPSAQAAQAATPAITSFQPTSGPVGTSVTINGTHFAGASSVKFNNTAASFAVNSDTQITTTVPSGATTGPIHVKTNGGTATSASSFTVIAAPTITSFQPTSGPVGTSVTINGTNFTGATAVKFSGATAGFTVNSATKITATVPAGATTGPIQVTTAIGTATSSSNFTVTSPAITSFAPTSGPVGTTVVMTGTNFIGATSVRFNSVSATFVVNSATQITATVPAGATTGPIQVTTPSGTGTSSGSFTVIPPPVIASFSPALGPVGTSVTIIGSGFTGATQVKFGSVSASFTVAGDTQITATVPAGATGGPITVVAPGGTSTSAATFGVVHPRHVTLQLNHDGELLATGRVSVPDGFTACERSRLVRIQRWVSGRWRWVAKARTRADGSYRTRVSDRTGRYRATAAKETVAGGDVCAVAISPVRRRG